MSGQSNNTKIRKWTLIKCLPLLIIICLFTITAISFDKEMFYYVTEPEYMRLDPPYVAEQTSSIRKCSVKERKDHLAHACLKEYGTFGLAGSQFTAKQLNKVSQHLLVDEKHKVLFCYVGKTGSTTYKSLFVQYSDIYKEQHGGTEFGDLFEPEIVHQNSFLKRFGLRQFSEYSNAKKRDILDTYFKVLAARNPLSRVHSMYKNKLVDRNNEIDSGECFRYNKNLGMDIIEEMRPRSEIKGITCATDVTFEEFAEYYARHPEINYDNHLIPVTDQCHPCLIKYDYFFKLETGDSDQRFLLETLFGETGNENENDPVHLNAHDLNSEDKWRDNEFQDHIKDYDNLRGSVVRKLEDIYRMDFELFGYDRKNQSTVGCEILLANGSKCC